MEWHLLDQIPNVYILSDKHEPSYSVAFDGLRLLVVHFNRPPGKPASIDAAIATAITPAIREWIEAQLPAWWDWEFATQVLAGGQIGDGRRGRFVEPSQIGEPWVLLCERAALASIRNKRHPQTLDFTPGAELVFAHYTFTLWSDGIALPSKVHPAHYDEKPVVQLTPEANELLAAALRRRYWRTDDRWRPLMMVSSVRRETLAEEKAGGYRNYSEKSLRRIETDNGLILYLTVEAGGYLAEDGDAWEYRSLWDNEQEARTHYWEIAL
jgi:hypothetical protein